MSESSWEDRFRQAGMVILDHFVYAAGDHGPIYVNKRVIYDPRNVVLLREAAQAIADAIEDTGSLAIVAPQHGAVQLGHEVARLLSARVGYMVPCVEAVKVDGGRFQVRKQDRWLLALRDVAVVEDIINTGGSSARVVTTAACFCNQVVGTFALVDRSGLTPEDLAAKIGAPATALAHMTLERYPADACPQCADGVQVNVVLGHGAEFLASKEVADAAP